MKYGCCFFYFIVIYVNNHTHTHTHTHTVHSESIQTPFNCFNCVAALLTLFSAILCKSSQARSGWMGTIGGKTLSGLSRDVRWGPSQGWATLGHSQSCPLLCCLGCVLRVIVMLEGEPLAQSEVLSAVEQVFIENISVLCSIQLSLNPDQSPSPCYWKTAPQHEAATSTLYFWVGTLQVMSRSGFLQTGCLELRFIRPDNIVS